MVQKKNAIFKYKEKKNASKRQENEFKVLSMTGLLSVWPPGQNWTGRKPQQGCEIKFVSCEK